MIFFYNDTATTEIYTLSLHDALPISKIKAVDKEQAMKLIEQDLQELKEISGRWRADMK